jgi:acyl carrier protein
MIFEKIVEALSDQLGVNPDSITKETDIMSDLGADSLDLVELIMTLEEEYGVSVVDESVYEHRTVGEIADFIESLIKG